MSDKLTKKATLYLLTGVIADFSLRGNNSPTLTARAVKRWFTTDAPATEISAAVHYGIQNCNGDLEIAETLMRDFKFAVKPKHGLTRQIPSGARLEVKFSERI